MYHLANQPIKKGKPANENIIKEKHIVKIILLEKYK